MSELFAELCSRNGLSLDSFAHLPLAICRFSDCVAACAQSKVQRRARTIAEFRSVSAKIMRLCPHFSSRHLHDLNTTDCEAVLKQCFSTARQRHKGYVILHGIFAFGLRRRWCSYNPVALVEKPRVQEAEIELLSWQQLQNLLRTARREEHRACLPALALMLWAGVRPSEVQRLEWKHLDWQEKVVVVPAQHAKTGGCRHVSLLPVLRALLKEFKGSRAGGICPADWGRRWKRLRQAAGLIPWRQDVLRHCFASYHVKRWHDYARLQAEMGHRSADLLRTRYLSMRGISSAQAKSFWRVGGL